MDSTSFIGSAIDQVINISEIIINAITVAIDWASAFLWGWPLIILLFGTHLYLTWRTGFIQKFIFKAIKISFQTDKGAEGDVSQ
ncbi:MAG: hypothetical protein B6D45_04340, partial [Ignavibacteriales bacterium UTCHB3]